MRVGQASVPPWALSSVTRQPYSVSMPTMRFIGRRQLSARKRRFTRSKTGKASYPLRRRPSVKSPGTRCARSSDIASSDVRRGPASRFARVLSCGIRHRFRFPAGRRPHRLSSRKDGGTGRAFPRARPTASFAWSASSSAKRSLAAFAPASSRVICSWMMLCDFAKSFSAAATVCWSSSACSINSSSLSSRAWMSVLGMVDFVVEAWNSSFLRVCLLLGLEPIDGLRLPSTSSWSLRRSTSLSCARCLAWSSNLSCGR